MKEKQKKLSLPSGEALQSHVERLKIPSTAYEIHGQLCGYLCVGSSDKAEQYLQTLLEEKDVSQFEKEIRALASLLQVTYEQMSTMSFDFHLLMPDDEEPLDERAKSLGVWCHGFSDGILNSGVDISAIDASESRDALFHITEIANIDYDYTTVTEEDEKAFMEVYEYVRMAVLMIHTELTGKSDKRTAEEGEDRTLH